ncbi:hypothetical protein JW721_02585 [Candidatus Micrarchaeota archaeon]|nr:hypothetical protein [Candidatus Micrarchaeota archaeon]
MSSGKLKGRTHDARLSGRLLATPTLTPDYVQRELEERVGAQLPPQIAQAILKTGNFQRLNRVAHTLKKIISHSGENSEAALNRFSDEGLSRLLTLHPGAFFMISRAAREGTPDALAALSNRELSSAFSKDPAKIASAFARIGRVAAKSREGAFFLLSQEPVATAFARNPKLVADAFARIGTHAPEAFWALASEDASREFAKRPANISRALRRIGKAAGDAAGTAFWAIEREGIFPMFLENPSRVASLFSRIGKSAGGGPSWEAFRVIGSEEVAMAFAKNPKKVTDALVRIGRAAGEAAEYAFSALRPLGAEFAKDPAKVAGIFEEACRICGRKKEAAFGLMSKRLVAKELSLDPSRITKLAEASAYSLILLTLSEAEKTGKPENVKEVLSLLDNPDKIPAKALIGNLSDYKGKWKAGRKLAREAGVTIEDREVFINFAYAQGTIGAQKTRELYNEFGIEYFARYSKKELESLYGHIGDKADGRPLLLVMQGKYDDIGVLYDAQMFGVRRELVEKGYYNIIFVEAENEREFYEKAEKFGEKYFGISALMIGAHGTADSIRLGPGSSEESLLDLTDEAEMRALRPLFSEDLTIVLNSCSTGKGKESIGPRISRTWGATLFAPELRTRITSFELTGEGELIRPIYRKGGKVFVNWVEQ